MKDDKTIIDDTTNERAFTVDDPQAEATEADVDAITEALSSEEDE